MPDHIRQRLADAIATACASLTTTGSNVFQGRTTPVPRESMPALLIFANGGTSGFGSMGTASRPMDWTETITVRGLVALAATDPERTLNTIAAEVQAALMATETLGGLARTLELVRTTLDQRVEGEWREGMIEMVWQIEASTPSNDATA